MAILESFTAKALATGALSVGAIGGTAIAINQADEGISETSCTTMDPRANGETIEDAYADSSVATLQQALIDSGAIESILGGADGDFGSISCTALDIFQEKNGLVNDLKLGPQTAGALGISLEALELKNGTGEVFATKPLEKDTTIDCYIGTDVLLRVGDKDGVEDNEDVRYLQRALNNAGYSMPADGDFGPITKDGLLKFQDEHQLGADCVVGLITYGALQQFADPLENQQPGPVVNAETTSLASLDCVYSVLSKEQTKRLLEENGVYDDTLCDAVLEFQKITGLHQDGQVGPQTALSLIKNADNSCNVYGTSQDDCLIGVQMNGNNGRVYVVEDGDVIKQIDIARFGNPERENGSSTPEGQFDIQRTSKGEYKSTNCIDENGNGYVCMWNPIFFDGGKAFHGTKNPGSTNGSLGCVGTSIAESEFIYAQYEAGKISKVVIIDFQRN